MALGYDGKLYILAFDHRGSFQKKWFGIEGDPTDEETATITDAKHLVYEGLEKALQQGQDPARFALLCFGVGSAFYIAASMGAGPRDSLMLVTSLRLGVRIGVAIRVVVRAVAASQVLAGRKGLSDEVCVVWVDRFGPCGREGHR